MTDEITSSKSDGVCLTDEIPKYSHNLCFTVSVRTNKFALKQLDRYSPEQEAVFQKIKSLHESGLGYRKIAKHLNENGILILECNKNQPPFLNCILRDFGQTRILKWENK